MIEDISCGVNSAVEDSSSPYLNLTVLNRPLILWHIRGPTMNKRFGNKLNVAPKFIVKLLLSHL